MTKVTLLGDSIRMGYAPSVIKLLGDDFEVFSPDDNCRFAKYTLRCIFDMKDDIAGSEIIHWNNGLWDECDLFGDGHFTSEDEYVSTMLRVAEKLQERCKTLIFATTTPTREENVNHSNSEIAKYNAHIVSELKKRGVIINDLFSVVNEDINRYIREDDLLHLTDEGIKVCAEKTAALIKSVK